MSGCEVEELTNLSAQLPMLLRANGIKRLMLEAERVDAQPGGALRTSEHRSMYSYVL